MKKITMQKSIQNATLEEVWNLFIKKKQVKNIRPATLRTYQHHYTVLIGFIDQNTEVSLISEETIDDFISYLKKRGIRDVTVNSYLRTIRTFFY